MAVQKGDINPKTGQAYAVNPATGVWDDTYWAEVVEPGLGGGGGGRSAEGIDLSQVPSAEEYVSGQFATEDVALKNLLMEMKAREDPSEIFTRLEEEAGLPPLRATATTLMKEIGKIEDYLLQIEPDVTGRTRESLVTEPQRRGMVAAERKPWIEKLARLSTAAGRIGQQIGVAERGVATKTQLALEGQRMRLEPHQLYFQVLTERHARQLTGFTTDRETQLDALWDKLYRQRELSDQEWALANNLAAEERKFIRELQKSAAEAGATIAGGESAADLLTLIGEHGGDFTSEEWAEFEDVYNEIFGGE
jgi:hypothetical protein